jgi:hypothetical protein
MSDNKSIRDDEMTKGEGEQGLNETAIGWMQHGVDESTTFPSRFPRIRLPTVRLSPSLPVPNFAEIFLG